MGLSPLLKRYDNVVLDLDGCVWVGAACTPGAPEAVAELRAAGKRVAFVTNNAMNSPEDYVRKLWSLGIQASLEEVVTAGAAVQYFLSGQPARNAYVVGSEALVRHVADAGHRIVNGTPRAALAELVVVAGHKSFNYGQLLDATRAVVAGADLVASDRDRSYPGEDGVYPGTGAILAALEYATERRAHVVGKPDPEIFRTALDRFGDGRTLVIGDRIDADLAGAAAAGLDAAIVLTGITSAHEAQGADEPRPVAIAPDLHALVTTR